MITQKYKKAHDAKQAVQSYLNILSKLKPESEKHKSILKKISEIEEAYSLTKTVITNHTDEVDDVTDCDVYAGNPMNFELAVARKYMYLMQSAVRRGKDFNLTLPDVRKLLSRKTCAYTGVHFSSENTRTVDRVDSNKGYVKGNVVAVTHKANQLKNTLFENKSSELLLDLKQLNNFCKNVTKLRLK